MSTRASQALPTLRGLRRLFARAGFPAVAVSALAIVVLSVPSSFEYYRSVCTAAAEV